MSFRVFGSTLLACALLVLHVPAQETEMERTYRDAQKALAAGDLEGAQRKFERISRTDPKIAEVHATLGAVLFQKGEFSAALRELEVAKKLKPSLPKLNGLIAMSQSELGQYTEALPPLEEAFRSAEDKPVKRLSGLELERTYTALRQDSNAVAVALEMQRIFPDDPEVLYRNERIFGNFAYVTVHKLVEVAPESIWRHQAEAEALESQGTHDAAIAEYRKVLEMDPKHHGIHYRIGRSLRERARDSHHPEDLTLAMQEFQAELKLDPENASAAYEIGELHRLGGELEAAKASFEAALHHYPSFPEANLGLGTVLAAMHQPEAALPYLKAAIASDPADQATWYRLAQVERALGHTSEQQAALKEFRRLHDGVAIDQRSSEHDVSRQQVESQTTP